MREPIYIGDCYTIEEAENGEIVLTITASVWSASTWARYEFKHTFIGKSGVITNTENTINGKPDTEYYESGEIFTDPYDLLWTLSDMLSNDDNKAIAIIDKVKPLVF